MQTSLELKIQKAVINTRFAGISRRSKNKAKLAVAVRHYLPGTSKWNKIEHGLFSFISLNWLGTPLTSIDIIVKTIANTTNRKGLKVFAAESKSKFQAGIKVPDSEMDKLCIVTEL